MRKLALFINVTIDGYFEGPDNDISFFKGDEEADSFAREQTSRESTILLGHKTFDLMRSFWPTEQGRLANPELAKYMNEMPKYAVSHRPFEPGWNNTAVISGNVPDEVKKLKEKPGSDIIILGSNSLCVSLIQQQLVDEFLVMVNPVVLGNGTPLFKGLPQMIVLKLMHTRWFKSGNVLLTYNKVSEKN